jgi:eukaryotic-like serine/threonine-protein kinase
MPLWNEIEGQTLNGLTLRKLLRSEGRTAWFSIEDPEGQPAVLSVFEALNDEDSVQARLEAAARVQHSNLLVIRSTGRGRLEDESLVYAVMEPFDQSLAEVLRDRTLTPDEAREVVDNLLSALESVEAAGLHHGHVDASGVLGVGDNIKLRSDCLMPRRNQSDAAALAALIYNALTGRRYSSERDALQLPAPFATLVRAGVGANGSLAAMRRVLNGPAAANGAVAAASSPAGADPSRERPAKAVAKASEPPRTALRDEPEARRKHPGIAIAAIVIMAIVLAIFWYALKRPTPHVPISGEAPSASSKSQSPAAATADVAPAAAPIGNAAGAMGAPETVRPAARPSPAKTSSGTPALATPSQDSGRSVWHVVVYTYSYESAAQRKAAEMAAQYPQFQPQVFSPTGHAPFLVVLGGGMNRQDAFTRREAALAAGLPKDTYAQNYRK